MYYYMCAHIRSMQHTHIAWTHMQHIRVLAQSIHTQYTYSIQCTHRTYAYITYTCIIHPHITHTVHIHHAENTHRAYEYSTYMCIVHPHTTYTVHTQQVEHTQSLCNVTYMCIVHAHSVRMHTHTLHMQWGHTARKQALFMLREQLRGLGRQRTQ